MPFRCKCGRTFEKLDTFGSHTSGCAPFHHRRISSSDIMTMASNSSIEQKKSQQLQQQQQEEIENNRTTTTTTIRNHNNKKRLSIQTDPTLSYFNQRFILLSPNKSNFFNDRSSSQDSSTTAAQQEPSSSPRSAPVFDGYKGFMMPTALSIQNTFEGVRRRSMSYSAASTETDTTTAAVFD